MRHTLKLAAATLALSLAGTPVMAEDLCGAEINTEGNMRVAKLGQLSAACEVDSICSIGLAAGNDLRVDMERASLDGSWLIRYAATSSIDTGAGIDLVFNGADETRVAPEFLIAAEDKKSVRVDDDVSQIMVTTMTEAKTMLSTVQFIGGKKINMEADLSDLPKALEWVNCAQAKQ